MKYASFYFFILIPFICLSQDSSLFVNKLPAVTLKTLDGKLISTSELNNNGKPMVVCFWKICCKSPGELLNAISDDYDEWVDETGVKLYAVSVDDSRNSNRIAPFVAGNGWEFEILLDYNSDFKRAMNVNILPHTIIINGKGEIIWEKSSYQNGDEEIIFEKIKEIAN
ncbi:MAG: hypothetical protein Kow0068_06950 [Marinilabiliales bacterium]